MENMENNESFKEPKQVTYFCKFDEEGRRTETKLSVDITNTDGYTELTEEQMQFLWGNKGQGDNGTGYVYINGEIVSAPPAPPQEPIELPPTLEERVKALEEKNEILTAENEMLNDVLVSLIFGEGEQE